MCFVLHVCCTGSVVGLEQVDVPTPGLNRGQAQNVGRENKIPRVTDGRDTSEADCTLPEGRVRKL